MLMTNWRCSHTESHRVSTFWLHVYPFRGMCAYRCALRPALRTVSRLALRGCCKIGSSNFEPLARSYRPANRRTFTAGRYPVAGNYSLIHVLLRCVLTLWPCARPAGQSGEVRKQYSSFRAVRIGVGAPFRKLRPCPSFRAVRLWAAVRLSFLCSLALMQALRADRLAYCFRARLRIQNSPYAVTAFCHSAALMQALEHVRHLCRVSLNCIPESQRARAPSCRRGGQAETVSRLIRECLGRKEV